MVTVYCYSMTKVLRNKIPLRQLIQGSQSISEFVGGGGVERFMGDDGCMKEKVIEKE